MIALEEKVDISKMKIINSSNHQYFKPGSSNPLMMQAYKKMQSADCEVILKYFGGK